MRKERAILGAILGLFGACTLWLAVGAAFPYIAQPADTDPQLFDLALAERELDSVDSQRTDIQNEIADILSSIDGLAIERDVLDLNRPARAAILQDARSDARRMAVAAYIGIGPPLSGFDILDAETASDLSWRNAMLRHQTERLNLAAETYALLAGDADANVLTLSDEIDGQTRRLEGLRRELDRLTRKIPRAEWLVEIATIHRDASIEMQRNSRLEPSAEQWRELRFCESSENYAIDTDNGFFGAYQFEEPTWETVGGAGNPALAPSAEQDARARLLFSRRGDQPWPICGVYLRR